MRTSTDSEIREFILQTVRMAVENARSGRGGPFAALVVKDGEIIGKGTNTVATTNDPTAHAEVVAIRNACSTLGSFQLEGCEIYSSCEPCPMCFGALYWARPAHVYFATSRHDAAEGGFDDEMIYKELNVPPSERRIPMTHYPVDEGAQIFSIWKELPDKVRY